VLLLVATFTVVDVAVVVVLTLVVVVFTVEVGRRGILRGGC